MKLDIHKCHGSGNDFILIDEMNNNYNLSETTREKLTTFLCHRNNIGADGILFYQQSKIADCRMRMFNPDGKEAEMCGNGIRCLARYCHDDKKKSTLKVETMKAILTVNHVEDISPGVASYETEIFPISLEPKSLPLLINTNAFIDSLVPELDTTRKFTALSVPNPHIITFVNELNKEELKLIGQQANSISTFPNGVNVSFCKLLDDNNIYVVTYERGVGITYSCGTAMSATAFTACLLKHLKFETIISVYNKGGFVRCKASNSESIQKVMLTGNATFVFKSTLDLDFDKLDKLEQYSGGFNLEEVENYEKVEQIALKLLRKYNIKTYRDRDGHR